MEINSEMQIKLLDHLFSNELIVDLVDTSAGRGKAITDRLGLHQGLSLFSLLKEYQNSSLDDKTMVL